MASWLCLSLQLTLTKVNHWGTLTVLTIRVISPSLDLHCILILMLINSKRLIYCRRSFVFYVFRADPVIKLSLKSLKAIQYNERKSFKDTFL